MRKLVEGDENLLNDDPINELFKEIEEEEFDLESPGLVPSFDLNDSKISESLR